MKPEYKSAIAATFLTYANAFFDNGSLAAQTISRFTHTSGDPMVDFAASMGISGIYATRAFLNKHNPRVMLNDFACSIIPASLAGIFGGAVNGLSAIEHIRIGTNHALSITAGLMGLGTILDRMKDDDMKGKMAVGVAFGVGSYLVHSLLWQNISVYHAWEAELMPSLIFPVYAWYHGFTHQYAEAKTTDPGVGSDSGPKHTYSSSRSSGTSDYDYGRYRQRETPPPTQTPLSQLCNELGLSPTTSTKEVKAAYRRFMKANHTDATQNGDIEKVKRLTLLYKEAGL